MSFFNHWWNLPYLIMLGLVGAFFVLQVIGLVGHDADVDHDLDADVDHDVDVDGDADADAGGATAGFHEVLAFFGLGRVPFMVIWLTLCIFTGFSGLFMNRVVFANRGDLGVAVFLLVLAAALAIGLVAVRFLSRVAARFVDIGGKGATAKHELAGRLGVVASAELDHRFGEVRVRDGAGNELLVHGHTEAGAAALPRGTPVVLIDFDAKSGLFWVTSSPDHDVPASDPEPV